MLLTAIVTNVPSVILITAAIELINLVIMVAKHIGAIVRLSARLVTLITAAIELINLVIMVAKHIGAIVRLSAKLVILITAVTEPRLMFRVTLVVHLIIQIAILNAPLGLATPATLNLEALVLQLVKPTHAAEVATQTLVALMAAKAEIPVAVAKFVIQSTKTLVLLSQEAQTATKKTDTLNKTNLKKNLRQITGDFFNYLSVLSTGNPLGHQTFRNLQIGHNHGIKRLLINIINIFANFQSFA